MFKIQTLRTLVLIWIAWFLVLYGFQWLVTTRLELKRPDYAVLWSESETMPSSHDGKIYQLEPFLNRQVAWDSEFYVGIAVGGYDDPAAAQRVRDPETGVVWTENYGFFPAYPYVMKAFMRPLGLLGMNPIATASLAAVIVALLGTLAGMIALWDLTREYLSEEQSLRAVFYMLIFPSGFFLAQVYTEGMFIGLSPVSLCFDATQRWQRSAWRWCCFLP